VDEGPIEAAPPGLESAHLARFRVHRSRRAMSLATVIRVTVLVSIVLLVFALGLRYPVGSAGYLFRKPGLLLRSLLAMNVLMPAAVILFVSHFELRPVVEVALAALAVSPVPPFLPGKQLRLVSRQQYIYGLLVASSILSVVLVPLTTAIFAAFVAQGAHVSAWSVLRIMLLTVLVPLSLGMLVRRFVRSPLDRPAEIVNRFGGLLLILALIPVLVAEFSTLRSLIGDGTLIAIAAFTALGLLIGHVIGGPDAQDRTVLALATASRHPAVALAVATSLFPQQQKLVPAAVLLSLIVGVIAAIPYTQWRKRVHAHELPEAGEPPIKPR
jgi:BASS family bile acid:Na+ symporter